MSQIIVNIIVAILGMAIGFTVCSEILFGIPECDDRPRGRTSLYVTRTGQASKRYLQIQICSLLHQSNRPFQRGHAK